MISAYIISDSRIHRIDLNIEDKIPDDAIWIDLCMPSLPEEHKVENDLGIELPTKAEIDKIEVRSPFYTDIERCYMTITVSQNAIQYNASSSALTFILDYKRLITIRYTDIDSIRRFTDRSLRHLHIFSSPSSIMINILEALVNSDADTLSAAGDELDKLLHDIFDKKHGTEIIYANQYNNIVRQIGGIGNIISKNRESLVSINRILTYFNQIEGIQSFSKKEQKMHIRRLIREVHSLNDYASFLSQRNSFLLDATLGMISVEQNMIIKIFTVAAAVFMPPTLIASIYGMNFTYMPELSLWFGYPLILLFIIISALIPYFFFKKKKWL